MIRRSMNNVYIMKVLLEKTNQDNPLTSQGIIDELKKYGMKLERKTIYEAIDNLITFGIDIKQSKVKPKGFYVAANDFDTPELKLLIDAVQSSKFITEKKSIELIDKIKKQTDIYTAEKLQRNVHISSRVKSNNEHIYYTIDKIHQAIAENKRISYQYCEYNLNKNLVTKKAGRYYEYNPVALIWDDEYYYLVVYDDKHDNYIHFRTDKMKNAKILDIHRVLPSEDFNAANYAKQIFSMFGGETSEVTLRVDNSFIGVIIDKFGKDIAIVKNDKTFDVTVNVAVSNSFFGWLFQLGPKVKIISPTSVIEKYADTLTETTAQYNN